jgi:hypothetical protein
MQVTFAFSNPNALPSTKLGAIFYVGVWEKCSRISVYCRFISCEGKILLDILLEGGAEERTNKRFIMWCCIAC